MGRIPEAALTYNNATFADAYAKSTQRAMFSRIEMNFVDQVLKTVPNGQPMTVLDVGSGPGLITTAIAKARPDWNVTGLDYSEHMLRRSGRLADHMGLEVRWIQGSADNLPFKAATVDLIVCHFALHEFPDAEAALAEMFRVLKPSGHFALQDLERPSDMFKPLLIAGGYLYHFFDPTMFMQCKESMNAAFHRTEIAPLLRPYGGEECLSHRFTAFGPVWTFQGQKHG